MKKILAYLLTMVMVLSVCTPMMVVQAAASTVDPYLDEALVEFAQTPQITLDLADGVSITNGSVANLTDGIVGAEDTADQAGSLGLGIDSESELTWADVPAHIVVDLGEGGQVFSGIRLYASIWRPWVGQTDDIYGYRALTKGFISISEDGEIWYDLDRQEFNRLERYLDFKIEKCGREVNANVRYVKVAATATTSSWWTEELALLAPDENLPTVSEDFEAAFYGIVKDELKAFFTAMLGEEAAAAHIAWADALQSDIADKNLIVDYIEQVIAENQINKIDAPYGELYEGREILAQVITGLTDTSVVEAADDELKATGLGYALLSDGENLEVLKVVPSPIALVVLTGQSNSAGAESDWTKSPTATGIYEDKIFITNTLDGNMDTTFGGEVTFTDAVYAAEHGGRTSYFPCSPYQGGPHPSSIRSAGLASALAMQLYDEWQTPVWVLNAGVSGCIIERFDPAFEGNDDFATHDAYNKVVGYSDKVKELIASNEHYYLDDSKTAMFWLQGCSNGIGAPNVLTMDEYREKFTNMYEGFKTDIGVNSANIILVRGQLANNGPQDFYMSGPRMAQIYMGNNNEDYADVNLIMNTDVLKSDAAVSAYFAAKYPDADAFEARWGYARPETHNGIKPTIHYNQEGYNEIGDESGINFRKIASGDTEVTEAVLLGYDGIEPEKFSINMENGETGAVAVPMPKSINFNASANLTVVIEDEDVATYNAETLAIEAVGNGETTATLMAGETVLAEYPVEVIQIPTLVISGAVGETTTLTLANKAGKVVTDVAYGDLTIAFDEANSNEEQIVITRANIKTIYPLLAPDTEQIILTVTYEDGETEEYPVNVVAEWVDLTGQAVTGTFAADEVVINATNYPDFKVRTDSYIVAGTFAFHAIQSFIKTHATLPATNALYRSIVGDGQTHYIDVDFGKEVTTSGLRYEINNFYHYFSNVSIYGSSDGENWTLIKSADETTQRTSDYLYSVAFDNMVTYRYYRMVTTSRAGSVFANINEIRFVKPSFVFSSKSGAQPNNNLTLPNVKGLEVKSVTGNGVALTVDSTSTTEQTVILRGNLMLALGATDGDIEIVVTYSDDSTETYIISTTAAWVKTSEVTANGNAPTYASDEVVVTDYTDFAVRASSYMTNGQMVLHPIQSFTRSNTVSTGLSQSQTSTNYHTIDVDFGEKVKTSGFRFETYTTSHYYKLVEVYGSDDCKEWKKLGTHTASATYSANEQTILFTRAGNYRYYRIYINSAIHFIKVNEMRFIKGAEPYNFTSESGSSSDASLKFANRAGKEVLSVKAGGTEITFDTENTTTSQITIANKNLHDVYAAIEYDANDVELTVTYTDETSEVYYVPVAAAWVTPADVTEIENAPSFATDEIDVTKYSDFAVRTSDFRKVDANAAFDRHPIHAFIRKSSAPTAYANSLYWPQLVNKHYIDVDFGTAVTTSGFRFISYNVGNYMKDLRVYGSNDFEEWKLLASKTRTEHTGSTNHAIYFEGNEAYRYYRIYMDGASHVNYLNDMRFIKAQSGITFSTMSSGAPETLTLTNKAGKAVSSVKIGTTPITFDAENTTTSQIKIAAASFDPIFENLGPVAKTVDLLVTYADETTEIYRIDVVADWVKATDNAAADTSLEKDPIYEEDEIDVRNYANFAVRADGINGKHPIRSFIKSLKAYGGENHLYVSNVLDNTHYVEVDFGEKVKTSGFRYELYSLPHINKLVKVYGSDDCQTWEELASKEETAQAATFEQELSFGRNVEYRYYRIFINSTYIFIKHGEMRFIAEKVKDEVIVKVETNFGGNVTSSSGTVAGDQTFNKGEEITLTATPNEGGSFKYWIEANTGRVITEEEVLTMSGSVGRNVQAVFKGAGERFISFIGHDKKTLIGHDTSTGFGNEPGAAVVPSALKAYLSGHRLLGWKLNDEGEILVAGSLGTDGENYFAVYEEYSIGSYALTLGEGGSIVQSYDLNAIPYGETVTVKAAAKNTDEEPFMYWKQNEEIVSYDLSYTFRMPANDITLTPVYGNDEVVKEAKITLIVNGEEALNDDGTKMAGFMITRTVPEGVEVVDTGIIYVRDSAYGDLTVESVGKTAANDKTVNVSLSNSKTSGQYKFNARYEVTTGIKAVAFITYEVTEGETTTRHTVYSAEQVVLKITE